MFFIIMFLLFKLASMLIMVLQLTCVTFQAAKDVYQ